MAASRHECSICMDSFKNPKLISCHHSFCYKCLEDYVQVNLHNGCFNCPICRTSIHLPDSGISGFQTNFYIDTNMNENFPCDICGPKSMACSRCLDCEENLCQTCCYVHEKSKATRHHRISDLVTLDSEMRGKIRQRVFCDQHPEEEIKLVCRDCKVTICLMCKAVQHDTHPTKALADVAAEVKMTLDTKLNQCSDKLRSIKASTVKGDELDRSINDAEQQELKAVDDQCSQLHQAIDQEAEKFKDKIKNVYRLLKEKNAVFRSYMEEEFKSCSNTKDIAENLRDKGTDIEIIKKGPDIEQLISAATSKTYPAPTIRVNSKLFSPAQNTASKLIPLIGILHDSTDADERERKERAEREKKDTEDRERKERGSENSKKSLVAAIDFGTTFSSWAFSLRHDYEREPTKIFVKEWNSGVGISCKAPTTALIRPDGETLDVFGYDAEDKYGRLAENDDHKDWYYFRRFNMSHFKDKSLTRKTMIDDEMGKKMAAIKVISLVIRYMKDDVFEQIESKIAGNILPEDIQFVLTVPAIWNDKARQFMREAAVQAGISKKQLLIALEPETASLYCRHIPLELKEADGTSSIVPLSPGTRFIVVDAGDGTIDITIHEVLEDGNVKEIYKATGSAWGGQDVDEAFKQFLIKIFGNPVLHQFKVEAIEDYVGLFREFELKKRKVSPNGKEAVTFSIPSSLLEIFKENTGKTLTEAINQTQFAANVLVIRGNKLRLDQSIMRGFFDRSLRSVSAHLQPFHEDHEKYGISVAVLVGGFAESSMLSGAIRENCSSWKVVVPDGASLIVLKGAVLYGYDQS